jgi:acid stress chaperone HdeB
MKFTLWLAGGLLAAWTLGAAPATAAIIDLSTWTCAKFRAADRDEVGVILSWLDGYYRDQDEPAVIDTDKFVANARKLGEYCAANPDIGLITATEKLFGK